MQTKNENHFPIEVNIMNNESISNLIETHGPRGFGTYIMIMSELRLSKNYKCGMSTINDLARRCKISQKLLDSTIWDFDLFELTRDEDTMIISSPYLDKVMKAYDERIEKLSLAGKKSADKNKRNTNGQFTSQNGTSDKIRSDKNRLNEKTTTVVVENENSSSNKNAIIENAGKQTPHPSEPSTQPLKPWEKLLNEAVKDDAWMNLLNTQSGLKKTFLIYRNDIVEAFRRHIQLHGTETEIRNIRDVKSYFVNFLRPGTPTHERIASRLASLERIKQEESPYRHETVDPETGERSYYGRSIPPDAPPRPDRNSLWSEIYGRWI